MADYMTQSMSSGNLKKITYYRKQKEKHVSHKESEAFTKAAISDYARTNNIEESEVEKGNYQSKQGVPSAGETKEI